MPLLKAVLLICTTDDPGAEECTMAKVIGLTDVADGRCGRGVTAGARVDVA